MNTSADTGTPAPAAEADAPASRRTPSLLGRIARGAGRLLRWGWPFLVLLLLFAVYLGWQRRSTGGETGFGLVGQPGPRSATGPAVTAPTTLRVGIYNIQGSVGKDADNAALHRIAQTLQQTDLAGLVEVRANARKSDDRNQAQRIAEHIGFGWVFAPAEQRFWAPGGGNAIVSRIPVDRWTRLPLPESDDPGSHRNVLLADVPFAGRTVRVMVTHLDRGEARARQLQAVTHLFASLQTPAVLLADLNTRPNDPLIRPLLEIPGAVDVVGSAGGRAGPERVDWIIARGLKPTDAGHVDDDAASDHAYLWADLELIP